MKEPVKIKGSIYAEIIEKWEVYGLNNIIKTKDGYKYRSGYGLEVYLTESDAIELIEKLGLSSEIKKGFTGEYILYN